MMRMIMIIITTIIIIKCMLVQVCARWPGARRTGPSCPPRLPDTPTPDLQTSVECCVLLLVLLLIVY